MLSACGPVEPPPTLTPTVALSGPTLAPSPPPFDGPPTEIDTDFADPGQTGGFDPTAAGLLRDAVLPPEATGTAVAVGVPQPVGLTLPDGSVQVGTLYTPALEVSQRVPGVLLLAPVGSDWASLPATLSASGFVVLSVPLAANADINDFGALMGAISETGGVNPEFIGVVGAGTGANLALRGCAEDARCDALLLLGPTDADANAIARYGARPVLVAASRTDAPAFAALQTIEATAGGEVLAQPFDDAGTGGELLLNRSDLTDLLLAWLRRQLQ